MAPMHPKQAVEIARRLIQDCTKDTASTFFGILAPQHIKAILFLAETVDDVTVFTPVHGYKSIKYRVFGGNIDYATPL